MNEFSQPIPFELPTDPGAMDEEMREDAEVAELHMPADEQGAEDSRRDHLRVDEEDIFAVFDRLEPPKNGTQPTTVSKLGGGALSAFGAGADTADLDSVPDMVDTLDAPEPSETKEVSGMNSEGFPEEELASLNYLKGVLTNPQSIPEALSTEDGVRELQPYVDAHMDYSILDQYVQAGTLQPLSVSNMTELEQTAERFVDVLYPSDQVLENSRDTFKLGQIDALDRQQELMSMTMQFRESVRTGDPEVLQGIVEQLSELVNGVSSSAEFKAVKNWQEAVQASFTDYYKALHALEQGAMRGYNSAQQSIAQLDTKRRWVSGDPLNPNMSVGEDSAVARARADEMHEIRDILHQVPLQIEDIANYLPKPPVLSGAGRK